MPSQASRVSYQSLPYPLRQVKVSETHAYFLTIFREANGNPRHITILD